MGLNSSISVTLMRAASLLLLLSGVGLLPYAAYAGGPNGPYGLTISAPRDLGVKVGNGNLTLTWSPPDKGAATMTGYRIYRAREDGDTTLLTTLDPDRLSHLDAGLDNGITYRYRMTAFNSIEESEQTPTVQGVPDGTLPTLTIISPSEGVFIPNSSVTVRWTAEDKGSGLSRFIVTVDGEAPFDNGLSSFVELRDLVNGPHNVVVRATDRAQNERSAAVSFTIDTEPPLLRVLSPIEGEVIPSAELIVSWAAEDEHGGIRSYAYSFDGEFSKELKATVTERSVIATNGRHTVSLSAVDRAGNTASTKVNFTVDLEDPVLLVLSPEDGSHLNSSSVRCLYYAADSATSFRTEVRLDQGQSVLLSGPDHTFDGLREGWHKLEMKVTDGAGRTAEAVTRFMVDTVAPVPELTDPDIGRPVSTERTHLSWKVVESGSGLRYCYISVDGGPYKRSERTDSGMVSLTEDGPHNVSVMAEDRAGNRGVLNFILILDTKRPGIISVGPRGDQVKEVGVIWALFDEELDPYRVEVTLNGNVVPATLDEGRNVTVVLPGPTMFGAEYHIGIRAADLAMNPTGEVSWTFSTTDEGIFKGRVVDEEGRPLGGALVVLDDGSTYVCGDGGTFEIGARMGERTIYFTAKDHKRYRTSAVIDPASATDLGIIVLVRDVPEEEGFLEGLTKDPAKFVLAALFVILLVLGAWNLLDILKDRGPIKGRKDVLPKGQGRVRTRPVEDEGRAVRGSRFRPGGR